MKPLNTDADVADALNTLRNQFAKLAGTLGDLVKLTEQFCQSCQMWRLLCVQAKALRPPGSIGKHRSTNRR